MNYVPLLVFTKIGHHDSCTVLYSILYYTKLYKIIHKNETAGSKGQPSCKKNAVFLNIVQKAFDPPPPLSFEHYVVNLSEGVLTKVCKRLSRQLSTK